MPRTLATIGDVVSDYIGCTLQVIQPHLAPRLKNSRAILLLPLWAFMACSRENFTLTFPPVSIVPPMLQIHLYLNTILIRRTSGRSLGTFKESNVLSDIGKYWTEKCFRIAFVFRGLTTQHSAIPIHGCETYYPTMREESRLVAFDEVTQ
jgi:hypothetical protein